jgi:hypothetical protein
MTIKSRFELSAVESNTLLTLSAVVSHLSRIAGAGRDAAIFLGSSHATTAGTAGREHATPLMNRQDKQGPAA